MARKKKHDSEKLADLVVKGMQEKKSFGYCVDGLEGGKECGD